MICHKKKKTDADGTTTPSGSPENPRPGMEAGQPRVHPHARRSGMRALQPYLRPGAGSQRQQSQVSYL
eukprot:9686412-Heterocapsa_arctica.AAC.1